MGKFEQAEKCLLYSILLEKKEFGEEYIGLALTYSNLGNVYDGLGKFELAEKYLKLSINL